MKWEVKYTVEKKDGQKKNLKEVIEARSVREAAMQAHSVIVRPLKSQYKEITILALKALPA